MAKKNQNKDIILFEDLSENDKKMILKYEEVVGKIYGRRKRSLTLNDIKKQYSGCVIPKFCLNMMKLVIENN
jgi:hypothetical protein